MTRTKAVSFRVCAALALLVLVGSAAFLIAENWGPSRSQFPIQGIDVSRHQGRIDWQRLRSQRVDFAYIKATEGGDWQDPQFSRNWVGAKAAGIRRGAYHFFTFCQSGIIQGKNFVATVPRDENALPPTVDLEFGGNCKFRPSTRQLVAELSAFLAIVEPRYGQKARLYFTQEFDEQYDISRRFDRQLWVRSIVLAPPPGTRQWTIWQASNFRRLNGIHGRVDWNVMQNGT